MVQSQSLFGRNRVGAAILAALVFCVSMTEADAARYRKKPRGGSDAPVARSNGGGGMSESGRYAAFVVDAKTGRVLFSRNAESPRYPASLTKMMTLYILFEEMERGRIQPGTPLEVSALAASQAPSKLGLRPGQTIEAEDAIKALVTKSANDASVVIAENVAGSVEAFAARMTRTARRIGMDDTTFRNPNGLPDPGQVTTAKDMVTLGLALQDRFPTYYRYFQTRSFVWGRAVHGNHNKLLGRVEGIDGIKTGYTNASGFNLVSSIRRDGRHLVAAVMGGPTGRARDAHMAQLLETYLPSASSGAKTFAIADAGARSEAPAAPVRRPVERAAAAVEIDGRADEKPVVERGAAVAMAKAILLPEQNARTADAGRPAEPLSIMPPTLPRPTVVASATPAVLAPVAPVGGPIVAASAGFSVGPAPVRTTSPGVPVPPAGIAGSAPAHAPAVAAPRRTVAAGVPVPPAGIPGAPRVSGYADTTTTQSIERRAVSDLIAASAREHEKSAAKAAKAEDAKAAAKVEEPKVAAKAEAETAKGWLIQIAAVDREAEAKAILSKARGEAASVLAGRSPVTEAVSKGGSTLYRARFAGFADQAAANAACAQLKRKDYSCLALRQ